jgi:hypothetical protein
MSKYSKYPDLDDCTEITSAQYMELDKPQFLGQTRVGYGGTYWMVFESGGTNYKILHKLCT